jgi:hypothetical protein
MSSSPACKGTFSVNVTSWLKAEQSEPAVVVTFRMYVPAGVRGWWTHRRLRPASSPQPATTTVRNIPPHRGREAGQFLVVCFRT